MSADIVQLLDTKQWKKSRNGWQSAWTFHTAQYCVALETKRRGYAPAGGFEPEERENFFARVVVYKHGKVMDYSMGGEAGVDVESPTVRHFHTSHFHRDLAIRSSSDSRVTYEGEVDVDHPFAMLVRDAIAEARVTMAEGRNAAWRLGY